ncbi:MAG: hypothetical protein ACREEM_38865 [Blastocatellia bacterium]
MVKFLVMALVFGTWAWVARAQDNQDGDACSRFKMRVVKPAENIDQKMVVKPAEGIDYKGIVVDPCRPPVQQVNGAPKKTSPWDQKPAPAITPWQRTPHGVEGGLKSPSEILRKYPRFPR